MMPKKPPAYTEDHAKSGLDTPLPEIETFPNHFPAYEVTLDNPEFTSVCPKTGLPDFGTIIITYMPDKLLMEMKSLKEYMLAYRNIGIFQENATNRILEDVVRACKPKWCSVTGDFRPRGGMGTVVEARWPRAKK
jgi:7-cyano-7-deazaguanine reductase